MIIMQQHHLARRNQAFVFTGLGIALLVAIFLSPWASSHPDGLDRVSQDHNFAERATEDTLARRLPFYAMFDEYALRGVPSAVATPFAGLLGTLATFGLAWGAGKLLVKGSEPDVNDINAEG
jgi:cobalt/nickel transport protein